MRRPAVGVTVVAVILATGSAAALATTAGAASQAAATRDGVATPYVGGTLNALGVGDVDYLDPNLTYYSPGYIVARAISRQLYSYPAIKGHATDTRPDLATGMPRISNGGKTYRITIRPGAEWDTSPARQVSAADVVRGVKIGCNPETSFGGLPDFESLIKGMPAFCAKFSKVRVTTRSIGQFVEHTPLPGVKAVSERTVQFTLTHRTAYFTNELTLPALSPRPRELDAYLPGSTADQRHTISDGPYRVTSYQPSRSIALARNPAWQASTDPLRKAYVDNIDISEGNSSDAIQKKLAANKPTADVGFDAGPSYPAAGALKAVHDPRLVTGPSISDNPFLVFNTKSPNSSGAMQNVLVRRAISLGLDRASLIASTGGAEFQAPLTHVLPPQIAGSRQFNDYPHNVARAKALLRRAGHLHPTVKVLYQSDASSQIEVANAIQSELKRAGIKVHLVGANEVDFYVRDLYTPASARAGRWDIAIDGWGPDWYGQAAASFFDPLFDGRVLPPASSDYGLFNSKKVDSLIDRASRAGTKQADNLWARADRQVMSDAAAYPIADPILPVFHAAQVHNFVLMPSLEQGDYTNMWLTPSESS